jgi:two-component system, LytTR family, sensor kinase
MGASAMKMSRLKTRLSSFWPLQIIAWSVYGVMIYITFLTVVPVTGMFNLLQVKFARTIVGFLLTSLLHPIYKRLIQGHSFRFIALVVLSCCVLFGLVWPVGESAGLFLLNPRRFRFEISMAGYPKQALDYTMTLLGWSAFYFGIKYWQAWQAERERALEAQSLAHQAQLEMLRYQLNPHFLFNALNSIRASIDEDSNRAKRMITEFSEFLRYSLLNGNSASIPLREEIEALRNYLAIEKIRFEDKLDVAFDVEPSAEEYRLPGFLIHPLVENAIKHGMTNHSSPLKLRLTARAGKGSLIVEVANTGRLSNRSIDKHSNSTGIGLKNVRKRLEQLFPERSKFSVFEDDGWIRAVIEINPERR